MKNRSREWSDLPPDILSFISKHLATRLLRLRFRAVCRSWRSSCPLPPHSNSLLSPFLPLKTSYSHSSASPEYTTVYISTPCQNAVYLIEPLQNDAVSQSKWLAMVCELTPGKLTLCDVFSGREVESCPTGFPKHLNLLDYRITEIADSCAVVAAWLYPYDERLNKYDVNIGLHKVISLPDPSFTSNLSAGQFYMAYLSCHGVLSIYSIWDLENWEKVTDLLGKDYKLFDDILIYKGKLYIIDNDGMLYVIDYEVCMTAYIVAPSVVSGAYRGRRKRLVESDGDLYMVIERSLGEKKLKVYKLNEHIGKWIEVGSLGNKVFLLGHTISFSFSTQVYAGFDADFILDFQGSSLKQIEMFHVVDGGTFEILEIRTSQQYCSGSIQPQRSCNEEQRNSGLLGSTEEDASRLWDIFWPPPSWMISAQGSDTY